MLHPQLLDILVSKAPQQSSGHAMNRALGQDFELHLGRAEAEVVLLKLSTISAMGPVGWPPAGAPERRGHPL